VTALSALAALLREEGGLVGAVVVEPEATETENASRPAAIAAAGPRTRSRAGEYELVVEAVYEGYLLHYGGARVLRTDDRDLALLVGDRLYALGLARLVALADGIRATARRHPAVFPLLLTRPAITPAARMVRDTVQAALREGGLPDPEAARAERLISTAVLGFAASEAAGRFRHHDQSVIDEDFAELLRWLRRVLPVPGDVP